MNQSFQLPESGPYTISVDWADHLAKQADPTVTLDSATWALPSGFAQGSATVNGSQAFITLLFSGLTENAKYTLVCTATLSNSDQHSANIPVVIKNLSVNVV